MFYKIFLFELQIQFRRPASYLYFAAILILASALLLQAPYHYQKRNISTRLMLLRYGALQ
jgi:hypothetical protein